MTVGGHGSLSPPPAPLSAGYCVYSRGALLSSHLPSPLPMGGEQLSWNHWTGENLVWLAAHLVLGDPCQAPGLGGGGGKRPASLGVFGGRPATQRGHSLQRGGYEAPRSGDKLWRRRGGEVRLLGSGPGLEAARPFSALRSFLH